MTGAERHEALPHPVLSVVVTIVDGGDAVRTLLHALTSQDDPPPMEILVPYDASASDVERLRPDFPQVQFLPLGDVATARAVTSAAGQHELYDRRRARALAKATGDFVAIVEDRGIPRPDWARTAMRLHRAPWAAIGGAIEPAMRGIVEWAVYVCDFSRYGLPFEGGSRDWVSDVNIVYKRRAIESTRPLWTERYQEPVVHWDLIQRGEELHLSPDLIVDHQRRSRPLVVTLAERFHWGRLFGHIRARHLTPVRRALFVAAAPLIPVVVLARHAAAQTRRGMLPRLLVAFPVLILLVGTWTAGEVWGYITGEP